MNRNYLLALLLILTFGCNFKNKKHNQSISIPPQKNSTFYTIDFPRIIENKQEVPLSEIAKNIAYIRLETTPKSILGRIIDVKLSKEYLFINHTGSPFLTQFDQKGKFIRYIGKVGRGPKEYALMRSYSIDPERQFIYITTNWTRKILVFSFEGEYIKTIKFTGIDNCMEIAWNRDSLFVQYSPQLDGNEKYNFIEINSVGDTLQKLSNHSYWQRKTPFQTTKSYWGRNVFYRYDNHLHFKGWYNDTVYTFNQQNKIMPKFLIDLKTYKLPDELRTERAPGKIISQNYYWCGVKESERYVFIRNSPYSPSQEQQDGYICYDKHTQSGVTLINKKGKIGFHNDIDGGPNFTPQYCDDSTAYCFVTALNFKKYLTSEQFINNPSKNKKTNEIFFKMNNHLKPDDNSILMIAKLKHMPSNN